ncbi:MAG: exodeoxyribonuclease VII small subunit [bacterium]
MSKKQPFAKSFEELEAIAAYFESENVDVEEGIKKFEEGMALAKACKERLTEIENKVVEIKKKFGEEQEEIPLP